MNEDDYIYKFIKKSLKDKLLKGALDEFKEYNIDDYINESVNTLLDNDIDFSNISTNDNTVINVEKCQCRLWNDGYGGQCSRNKYGDSEFCKQHDKKPELRWCGMITEEKSKSHPDTGEKLPWRIGKKDLVVKDIRSDISANDNSVINVDKCQCRIWRKGCGGQCSLSKYENSEFCKKHYENPDKRWCGMITEERPVEDKGVKLHWK